MPESTSSPESGTMNLATGRSYTAFSGPPSFSKRHKTDPHGGVGNCKTRKDTSSVQHLPLSVSAQADERQVDLKSPSTMESPCMQVSSC